MINKLQKGFTLIEILIVIAIIGLIMGVFLPNFNEVRRKSRDQARKADIKAIAEALELYKLNQDPPRYPSREDFLALEGGEPWVVNGVVYMNRFPVDPLAEVDPDEFHYRYGLHPLSNLRYILGTCLEDPNDPQGASLNPEDADYLDGECTSNNWYYRYAP